MDQLIALLPANVPAERILAIVTVVMTTLAALGYALDAALPRLRAHAEKTASKTDDKIVGWLASALTVLHLLSAITPRPRFGEKGRPDV